MEHRLYNPDFSLYFGRDKINDVLEAIDLFSRNGYVLMLSREEGAYILDGIHTYASNEANRNDVVFVSREDFEMDEYEISQEALEQEKLCKSVETLCKIRDEHKYESADDFDKFFEHTMDCMSEPVPEDFWKDEEVSAGGWPREDNEYWDSLDHSSIYG